MKESNYCFQGKTNRFQYAKIINKYICLESNTESNNYNWPNKIRKNILNGKGNNLFCK